MRASAFSAGVTSSLIPKGTAQQLASIIIDMLHSVVFPEVLQGLVEACLSEGVSRAPHLADLNNLVVDFYDRSEVCPRVDPLDFMDAFMTVVTDDKAVVGSVPASVFSWLYVVCVPFEPHV